MTNKKNVGREGVDEPAISGEKAAGQDGTSETEAAMGLTAEAETRIYIGPSFRGVSSGTVYKSNALPPALEAAINGNPTIKELVIPVTGLVEAKKQLQNPKSALSRFYEASKGYQEGKENV